MHRSVGGATRAAAFRRGSRATSARWRGVVEQWLLDGRGATRRRQLTQERVDRGKAHVVNLVDRCGEQNGWCRVLRYRRPRTAAAGCAAERPARRNRPEPQLIPPDVRALAPYAVASAAAPCHVHHSFVVEGGRVTSWRSKGSAAAPCRCCVVNELILKRRLRHREGGRRRVSRGGTCGVSK